MQNLKKCKILKIEEYTEEEIEDTYNIEVEDNHNYFANGILAKNCHHTPANSFLNIIKKLYSKRMYGLSATPNRKDQLQFLLYNYIGPTIYEVKDMELRSIGKYVPTIVERIKTNFNFDFGALQDNFVVLTTIMSSHKMRNEIILEYLENDVKAGRHPMVLCNRVKHAEYLKDKLESRNYKVGILTGKIEDNMRNKYKALALAGKIDVMVCMEQIAGEGLDIPIIDTIHIPYLINNKDKLKQIIGRGCRNYKDKEFCSVKIYDDFIYYNGIDKETLKNKRIEHYMSHNVRNNQNKWFRQFGYDTN